MASNRCSCCWICEDALWLARREICMQAARWLAKNNPAHFKCHTLWPTFVLWSIQFMCRQHRHKLLVLSHNGRLKTWRLGLCCRGMLFCCRSWSRIVCKCPRFYWFKVAFMLNSKFESNVLASSEHGAGFHLGGLNAKMFPSKPRCTLVQFVSESLLAYPMWSPDPGFGSQYNLVFRSILSIIGWKIVWVTRNGLNNLLNSGHNFFQNKDHNMFEFKGSMSVSL